MTEINKLVDDIVIRFQTNFNPQIAIVLGTRLSNFLDYVSIERIIDFKDIPELPPVTGIGHRGRFVFGTISGIPLIISDGRYHCYEGYDSKMVTLPIRVMHRLGAEILVETNISGGINPNFNVGDIMMITDQLSLFAPSPLIGIIPQKREDRFVDMSDAYDKTLNDLLRLSAIQQNVNLKEGVYAQVQGPNYETCADVRALKVLGADAVGMSTAIEVIVAKQLQMNVCALSYISNIASGLVKSNINRDEILTVAKEKNDDLYRIIVQFIKNYSMDKNIHK